MKRMLPVSVALACCLMLLSSCSKTIQPDNSNKQPAEASSATNQQVTAQQILDQFLNAGLPIYNVITYTEDTPDEVVGRPGSYVEKIVWADKREHGPSLQKANLAFPFTTKLVSTIIAHRRQAANCRAPGGLSWKPKTH